MNHAHIHRIGRGLESAAAARYLRPRRIDLEARRTRTRSGPAGPARRYLVAFGAGFALAAAPGSVAAVAAATTSGRTGIASGGDTPTHATTTVLGPGTGIMSGGDAPVPTTTHTTTASTPTPPPASSAPASPPVTTPTGPPPLAPGAGVHPRSHGLDRAPLHAGEPHGLYLGKHLRNPKGARHRLVVKSKARPAPRARTEPSVVPAVTAPLTVWDGGFSVDPFTASQL